MSDRNTVEYHSFEGQLYPSHIDFTPCGGDWWMAHWYQDGREHRVYSSSLNQLRKDVKNLSELIAKEDAELLIKAVNPSFPIT